MSRPGEWPSPVTAELIAAGGLRLAEPCIHDGKYYWLEGRPAEKGRTVLMCRDEAGQVSEVTPASFSVRSTVHEYGGAAWCFAGATLCFVNHEDQCLYVMRQGESPVRLTRRSGQRFTDLCHDQRRRRLIAVCEDHGAEGEAVTRLVAVSLEDGSVCTLASGADFYASPCLDEAGERLAWLSWDHPDMPWDTTRLELAARLDASGPLQAEIVAGGGEAIFQPRFGPDGRLWFISDRSGWWNLCRLDDDGVVPVMEEATDFGFAQWVFGMSSWDFLDDARVLCTGSRDGIWGLALLDPDDRRMTWLDLPFNTVEHVRCGDCGAVLAAAGARMPMSVVAVDIATLEHEILRSSASLPIADAWISEARPLTFPTSDGATARGFYYPPLNPGVSLPDDTPPPLLVKCHGGPTGHADAGLDLRIQFWTSRGFAVLDVNYRGSAGFGRAYREALRGRWGVADVDDAEHGARYLAEQGLADPQQLFISGGSAGGFTVLCALTFRDTFRAGASLYGVSDLASLARDTHKFEAHYLDRLVGSGTEARALYEARSPLHHAERLSRPVIFLQGLKDRVVTPDQSERMAGALRARGIPVLYLTYPEEGHGFRRAETVKEALEAELYFYGRVAGFEPPGLSFCRPVDNLDN